MAAAVTAVMVGLGIGAAPAGADPSNAPSAFVGTADCGPDGTFSFVVNSGGGNGQGTAFGPAFVSSDGGRALFIPTELDLTFTSPLGSFPFDATKDNTVGTVTCDVSGHAASGAPLSFDGTVVGNLVTRG
jgi:hypothetical protein